VSVQVFASQQLELKVPTSLIATLIVSLSTSWKVSLSLIVSLSLFKRLMILMETIRIFGKKCARSVDVFDINVAQSKL
jgi:hypothetical protein